MKLKLHKKSDGYAENYLSGKLYLKNILKYLVSHKFSKFKYQNILVCYEFYDFFNIFFGMLCQLHANFYAKSGRKLVEVLYA